MNKWMDAMRKAIKNPDPINRYWDDTLKAWVTVYPMKVSRTYRSRTGASWASKSGKSATYR